MAWIVSVELTKSANVSFNWSQAQFRCLSSIAASVAVSLVTGLCVEL
jgi:hypothetical protein